MDKNSFGKKGLVVVVILLFISVSVVPSTAIIVEKKSTILTSFYDGDTLYVGGDGSGNYSKIQDAIDNASDGDTVFVYNGTYYENVIVHKAIDLVGEDATTTIIDGMHIDDPLWINTSSINVCGFTITNSLDDRWSQGICVIDKKCHGPGDPYIALMNITISGCIVEYNSCGIRLDNTRNVEIAECIIRNNSGLSVYNIYSSHVCIHHCMIEGNGNEADGRSGGIVVCKNPDLGDSEDVEIFNCTIINNIFGGVMIYGGSSHINVHHNWIKRNSQKGVFVSSSSAPTHNISIRYNNIFENGGGGYSAEGICLQGCSDSVNIEKNQISFNTRGVYLLRSSANAIVGNSFRGNGCGINLDDSSNNFIDTNTILANNGDGILFSYSNDNIISRNNISSYILAGISFRSSNNNIIFGNTFVKSYCGIFFECCSNDNHVTDNIISNSENGIYFHDSHGNYIDNNSISNNDIGIKVYYSIDNVFSDNTIADNIEGICFYNCVDNGVYHNVFCNNSKRNAFFYTRWSPVRSNKWNGNYWDRPRVLPYPVFGRIGWILLIPWVNIDWHPD